MLKRLGLLITAALTLAGWVNMAEAGGRRHGFGYGSAYGHGYYRPRPVYGYGYGYRPDRPVYRYVYGYRPYYGYGHRGHRGKGSAIAAGLGLGLIGGALPAQAAEPPPVYNAPAYPGYQGYNNYRPYGD
jgi:hypothetical protein